MLTGFPSQGIQKEARDNDNRILPDFVFQESQQAPQQEMRVLKGFRSVCYFALKKPVHRYRFSSYSVKLCHSHCAIVLIGQLQLLLIRVGKLILRAKLNSWFIKPGFHHTTNTTTTTQKQSDYEVEQSSFTLIAFF